MNLFSRFLGRKPPGNIVIQHINCSYQVFKLISKQSVILIHMILEVKQLFAICCEKKPRQYLHKNMPSCVHLMRITRELNAENNVR